MKQENEKGKNSIIVRAQEVEVAIELDDTLTAKNIWQALPAQAQANTWGEEIYFTLPVESAQENMQEVVEMGAVAYWGPGRAMCLFFGPTPASDGDEIRPASAVEVFGRIVGDPKILRGVRQGETVTVERA